MSVARSSIAGFGLAEALVATAIFTTISIGVAPLVLVAGGSISYARDQTMTAALGAAKLDELAGLAWGYRVAEDGSLVPIEDTRTNLGVVPPDASGPGLAPSPGDTLLVNTTGYVDFLDARGRWMGTGLAPPAGARYVRRWSVTRWTNDPDNCLLLRVVAATTNADSRGGVRLDTTPRRADTWLFSMKTRVRP